jgi:putative ABC transport system substrate-binding protein
MAPDLVGKQLEVLKEVVPTVARVALLRQPTNPASADYLREAEAAARILGVRLQTLDARNPQEIDSAFTAMTGERAGALLIFPDALFGTHRRRIAELAAKRHLPAIHGGTDYADDGGFMVYSPNTLDLECPDSERC